MPLDQQQCNECGESHQTCPSCGSQNVLVREPTAHNVERRHRLTAVVDVTDISDVTYEHTCWNCGWTEELTISIERAVTNEGETDGY